MLSIDRLVIRLPEGVSAAPEGLVRDVAAALAASAPAVSARHDRIEVVLPAGSLGADPAATIASAIAAQLGGGSS